MRDCHSAFVSSVVGEDYFMLQDSARTISYLRFMEFIQVLVFMHSSPDFSGTESNSNRSIQNPVWGSNSKKKTLIKFSSRSNLASERPLRASARLKSNCEQEVATGM